LREIERREQQVEWVTDRIRDAEDSSGVHEQCDLNARLHRDVQRRVHLAATASITAVECSAAFPTIARTMKPRKTSFSPHAFPASPTA